MDKKELNQERINVIRQERCELLKEVREKIQNGNEQVINSAEDIIAALNYDEKNIKKYDALKEAQGLIEILTMEILKANSKEERDALRKKLNYYINKVKNEAKKRNIDYSKYMEKVTTIRKNISKYVRLVKREQQSNEIDELNYYYDSLTDEEKKNLSRKITNARNYNTRVIREKNNITSNSNEIIPVLVKEESEKEKTDEILEVSEIPTDSNKDTEKVYLPVRSDEGIVIKTIDDIQKKRRDARRSNTTIFDEIVKRKTRIRNISNSLDDIEINKNITVPEEKTYASDEEFISAIVKDFNRRYGINETLEYNSTVGKNMINFFKNISAYTTNKKILKRMAFDYLTFHFNEDLSIYMDYVRKDNSVMEGLRRVFNKSALFSKEEEYLNNHDRCVNWILSVVRDNNINLNYKLAK